MLCMITFSFRLENSMYLCIRIAHMEFHIYYYFSLPFFQLKIRKVSESTLDDDVWELAVSCYSLCVRETPKSLQSFWYAKQFGCEHRNMLLEPHSVCAIVPIVAVLFNQFSDLMKKYMPNVCVRSLIRYVLYAIHL